MLIGGGGFLKSQGQSLRLHRPPSSLQNRSRSSCDPRPRNRPQCRQPRRRAAQPTIHPYSSRDFCVPFARRVDGANQWYIGYWVLETGVSKAGGMFLFRFLGWADVKGLFLSEEARKDGLIPWVLVGGGSYRTLYVLNLQVLGISKQLTRTVIMAKACYDPEAAVLV